MTLETLSPDPEWEPDPAEREAADTIGTSAPELTINVWGGDWCSDCQAELPRFAAALASVGIEPGEVEQYVVEKREDGTKVGPKVDTYRIEAIPTIVIERGGTEVARFVESGKRPAIVELADALRAESRAG